MARHAALGGAFLRVQLDPYPLPCEKLAEAQCRMRIACALTQLDARARRAIELAFFHDFSHGELAEHMTVPLGTVKTWIRRGRQKLRPHVESPFR